MGDVENVLGSGAKGRQLNEVGGTGLKGDLSRNLPCLPLLLCVIRNSYAGAKKMFLPSYQ